MEKGDADIDKRSRRRKNNASTAYLGDESCASPPEYYPSLAGKRKRVSRHAWGITILNL